MFLTADPDDSMQTACVSRNIILADGRYTWGTIFASGYYPWFDIVLNASHPATSAEYVWTHCFDPQSDNGDGDPGYREYGSLDPVGSGSTISYHEDWDLPWSGTFKWGSYLDPHF
ncbi:hypothetical protein Cci01nite_20380 [Catellatospora citrea]|uniref:Uncharacterized protein n=1 Tax=Catellatospora citrea TaxID=53366 RepID=A0A8J3KA51_9ACTN|nr:hypothetical protein [Catellatospora citrea]GIF96944.1 hypothetical protein Cci01nite_20380 [Catellatospora citrea]